MSGQRTFSLRKMNRAGIFRKKTRQKSENTEHLPTDAAARFLQLPEDYRRGCALVTMEGRERVCIENFKGICSYTEQEVSLMTQKNRICVRGRRLRIDSYAKDQIEISGFIELICYE